MLFDFCYNPIQSYVCLVGSEVSGGGSSCSGGVEEKQEPHLGCGELLIGIRLYNSYESSYRFLAERW